MSIADTQEKYPWAVNPMKVERAVVALNKQVADKIRASYTEEDVKALYLQYGGLLLEEAAADITERAKYFKIAAPAAANLNKRVEEVKAKKAKKADKAAE